ncbi:hypothetical protein SAMN05444008_11283 [Cnuella takakiae]|uniref:Uncharacterized protein n=1 Tax=Cnuella takakiae TaxID=1302690 RepID=A0A1M5EKH3_9BACT|nr:hypothetical protein [Cnuella takakiae]OLY91209.1 hypothetical protein BUE76_04315 [Cnuella takakiae]SHF79715.1 hypothetical protein SAMN05444008_11283 [Cnuella takakiae]
MRSIKIPADAEYVNVDIPDTTILALNEVVICEDNGWAYVGDGITQLKTLPPINKLFASPDRPRRVRKLMMPTEDKEMSPDHVLGENEVFVDLDGTGIYAGDGKTKVKNILPSTSISVGPPHEGSIINFIIWKFLNA